MSGFYANFNFFIIILVCLWTFGLVSGQNDCNSGPCFPSRRDISSDFNATVNSTCGDNGTAEQFCNKQNCLQVCNANDPKLTHPASFINDALDKQTFWKSKNTEQPVYIQFDFGAIFMLYQTIIYFEFEMPAAMFFSKSKNYGASFHDLAFYSTNCLNFFNMTETPENRRNGMKVECFKIDQNVAQKLIDYAPMKDSETARGAVSNHTNQNYFLMTNIRVMLVKYITPPGFNPATAVESLLQSLFFAVKNLDIMASCFCNGQASQCSQKIISKCICERNTAGQNCERCLPQFNNKPYRVREACEDCGCNNHSLSCTYDAIKRYGVCENCTDNTMGDKCELCKPKYYRNSASPVNHTDTCLACACNLNGVHNTTNNTHCDGVTGQCDCKTNVTGRACDTCKDTLWRLSSTNPLGCEGCRCTLAGTVNESNVCDKVTGQCPCKQTLTGKMCDRCKDGYYGLMANNPAGCTACGCDTTGSLNISCNSTGGCFCRPRFYGLKCDKIESGFYVPSLSALTYEAENGELVPVQEKKLNHSMVVDTSGQSLLFVGIVLGEGSNVTNPTRLTLLAKIPKTADYDIALRYMTNYNWQLIKITLKLRAPAFSNFSCNGGITTVTSNSPSILLANLTAGQEAATFGSKCLREGTYTVEVEIQPGSAGTFASTAKIAFDSVVIYPSVTKYAEYRQASVAKQQNVSYYHGIAPNYKAWSGQAAVGCKALSGFYGYLYEEGQGCSCNSTGSNTPSVCNQCGGQCSCKPHVIGRTCDACRPDYYNFTSGFGCQACACNMVGANRTLCHSASGQCQCKHSVMGRQCSQCVQYYYNFSSGAGCSPCDCNTVYSRDLQCHLSSGKCPCKPGVDGTKCTHCQDEFYNLTSSGCTSCGCNLDGSRNAICNKTTGQCPCRGQTLGRTCGACPTGYYGLGTGHPAGCLKCQCSGKTINCTTDSGWVESEVKTELLVSNDNTEMDGWKGVNKDGQEIGGVIWNWDRDLTLDMFKGFLEGNSDNEFYFAAPAKYLTTGRSAYTYSMTFGLQQTNDSSPEFSTKGDIILKGRWFTQVLVTTLPSPPATKFVKYEIKFLESNWRVGTTVGRQATSYELVAVLSSLQNLYIRGRWTTLRGNTYKTRIMDIKMKYSKKGTGAKTATNMETCRCPSQYVGQFCERCATGYTRAMPSGGAYTPCVPCKCNGHSSSCDPETGICHNCQHNTTGNHCERCSDGLYGNATQGTSSDCRACPCPGGPFSSNTFARTCLLNTADNLPTCVNCTTGHTGRRCENCADGYYGTPAEPTGRCIECNCNSNVDQGVTGNCNTTTGECLKCVNNTTGFSCQWCAAGYYGNAVNGTCKRCNCSAIGSMKSECHNVTGQCPCHLRVVGRSCDRCEANAFNYSSGIGCAACDCHPQGANSTQCDLTTGKCDCQTSVLGDKCDSCARSFYDVTKGCIACNCHENYTQPNTTCNVVTGQCPCNISKGGGYYGGRTCDTCALRTVGKPEKCFPCTEPCYDNWYKHIDVEVQKVTALDKNVSTMLESFGGLSVDKINSTLQDLNRNLTDADAVFKGAQYNTNEKKEQIMRIRAAITDLQRRLNSSERVMLDAQAYIMTKVYNYNGTVEVVPVEPNQFPPSPVTSVDAGGAKVYADWRSLAAMATVYRDRVKGYNASGDRSYASISRSYSMIRLANTTATIASRQIAEAMTRLNQVATQRSEVEARLGSRYDAELQVNDKLLEKIRQLSTEVSNLLRSAKAAGDNAMAAVDRAERTIEMANTTATLRKTQAQQALENATDALTQATEARTATANAQRVSSEFKANATGVLSQAQTALNNVTQGINTIQRVTNMTRDSQVIAQSVRAKTMPVTLEAIKRLATDIKNTPVNHTLINKTYDGAAEGLKKAREVEVVSQRAINVAQTTLNEVQSIDISMSKARTARTDAENLQRQTDSKVTEINNITQAVQYKFSSALSMGEETLNQINTTIRTVEESLKCFNESKQLANTAAVTAEKAYNLSQEAQKVNTSISAVLPGASSQINALYNTAKANYTEITSAHNDTIQLLKDVREAEVLLQDYTQQREEMNKLKTEIAALESELDILNGQFDENMKKYESCGST